MTTVTTRRNERRFTQRFLPGGTFVLLVVVIFLLPFFNTPNQSIVRNTLSDLGAQNSDFSWAMNSVFVLLGLSSLISGWQYYKGRAFNRLILGVFAVALILSALFNDAPVTPGLQYNISEAGWHSYFACTTWLTFIILALSTAVVTEKEKERNLAAVAGSSALLLIFLASEAAVAAGIWQRLLFILSFGWMNYTFQS